MKIMLNTPDVDCYNQRVVFGVQVKNVNTEGGVQNTAELSGTLKKHVMIPSLDCILGKSKLGWE